jgi:lysophospholipase L1-like esterase
MNKKNKSISTLLKSGIYAVLIAVSFAFLAGTQKSPVLYLIGDSTMADKEKLYLPERGWGQLLPELFTNEIIIENHAKNGRSTRSFIYEGRWDSVSNKFNQGDFVIIQFGHNDASIAKTERYATPVEYEYNLRKFVKETRLKNAIPILATSIVRRNFNENNEFTDTHGEYPDIVRRIAADMNVPLLDMHQKSMELVSDLGSEKSKELYLHIMPNQYDSLPDGKIDNTHFSEFGALEMAKIAASEIKMKVPKLANYLKP